jgi:protocatechuate 3,4-dioxygenase alpha subunit
VAGATTPSQTVGPFFGFALPFEGGAALVPEDQADAIVVSGAVLDGEGAPVGDALIELWQANRAGRYAHPEDTRDEIPLEPGFTGFGRCPTDSDGRFSFVTVKPGPVPDASGRMQAPHIDVNVFARGLLKQLVTRIYFPDESEANGADAVLGSVEPDRRSTLVAVPDGDRLRFDIHLQGDLETVFFAL